MGVKELEEEEDLDTNDPEMVPETIEDIDLCLKIFNANLKKHICEGLKVTSHWSRSHQQLAHSPRRFNGWLGSVSNYTTS